MDVCDENEKFEVTQYEENAPCQPVSHKRRKGDAVSCAVTIADVKGSEGTLIVLVLLLLVLLIFFLSIQDWNTALHCLDGRDIQVRTMLMLVLLLVLLVLLHVLTDGDNHSDPCLNGPSASVVLEISANKERRTRGDAATMLSHRYIYTHP